MDERAGPPISRAMEINRGVARPDSGVAEEDSLGHSSPKVDSRLGNSFSLLFSLPKGKQNVISLSTMKF